MTFVLKVQSQSLIILGWYLPKFKQFCMHNFVRNINDQETWNDFLFIKQDNVYEVN